MTEFDLYLFIALAVLVAYLLWSFNRRLGAEIARAQGRQREWEVKGFEAARVTRRIELLRRDYVSAVRSRRPSGYSHMERVVRAKCAVRELSFFHRICAVTAAQLSNEKATPGPVFDDQSQRLRR
jgi:hypothetical protein